MKSRISTLRTASLDDDSQTADLALEQLIEQITARLQVGESINLERLAEEHPQYAAQIRELLPAIQMLAGLGESPVERTATNGRLSPPQQQLGDFRLIRELGRGGMGVVYEAEQISLGRRVALKVLPFAGMLDQQQLARFKNEARAAATLKHPHIVSVYSVGCERSVHYYAMELVEGHSLAQLIAGMRKGPVASRELFDAVTADLPAANGEARTADTEPGAKLTTVRTPSTSLPAVASRDYYRTVARLGIEAAGALDHAHQNGILHRDIKPANLLVDGTGKLWITDFGLARLEADAGMTMTGDLLGTLRYMSPEQALAKRVVVDHRSDIYSLGATLHELLTQQPAFSETDRSQLLKQIAFEEPHAPRQIDRKIPVELETIVLKAMRKNPDQRYATASELADDLHRYLKNQPIKAKPPTWRERAIKWSRRHVAIVWSAAAATLATAIMLAVSTVLISGALMDTKKALTRADDERVAANNARDAVARERDAGYQKLYVAQMRLAKELWDRGDVARMQDLLDEHLPRTGRPDLRGWEWYYLRSIPAQGDFVFRDHAETSDQYGVRAVAWSPDGRRVATGALNQKLGKHEIIIWDPATGTTLQRLVRPQGDGAWFHEIAWSPEGKHLATFGSSGKIGVWEVNAGERCRVIDTDSSIRSGRLRCSWSPDGTKLTAPSANKTIGIWDATSGERLQQLQGHHNEVLSSIWSPDGKSIAAMGHEPGWITIFDVASGEVRKVLTGEDPNWPTDIRWSPDSTRIACGGLFDATAKIWDVSTGEKLLSMRHSGYISNIAFSPDGKRLATTIEGDRVTVWDATTGQLERTLQGHDRRVNSVAWSPDGKRLITGAKDGLAKIWNVEHDATILPDNDHVAWDLAWSPDDRLIAYQSNDKTLYICDASNGKRIASLERHDSLVRFFGWSSDGRLLATRGSNAIRVSDAESGKTLHTWTHEGLQSPNDFPPLMSVSAAWHPNGRQIATVNEFDNFVKIWDAESARLIHSFDSSTGNYAVAWSPDGERLVTIGGPLQIWDAAGWRKLHSVSVPTRVHCIAWSSDGRYLALGGSAEAPTQIVDTVTGRAVRSLNGHTGRVQTMTRSADGRRLMSCDEGKVHLWDTTTGDQLLTFDGRSAAAWSHDEKRIAVISDGKIRIHDASIGYKLVADPTYGRHRARFHRLQAEERLIGGNYAEAFEQFELALRLDPDDPTTHTAMAWHLANCVDERFRDPRRALQLARSATKALPDSISAWQVLGWALYRTGDWAGSVEALQKSVVLQGDGGDPWQWFVLAMAEWQLGNHDSSRDWNAKAIDWIKQHPQNEDGELHRFRTEAEKLFGVTKSTNPGAEKDSD